MKDMPEKELRDIERAQSKLNQANKKLATDLHKSHPNPRELEKDCEQVTRCAGDCEKIIKECCKKCS